MKKLVTIPILKEKENIIGMTLLILYYMKLKKYSHELGFSTDSKIDDSIIAEMFYSNPVSITQLTNNRVKFMNRINYYKEVR